ncbi:hypothetical protein ONZ45_g8734 [Pleurotus djamor]|nr:hypothetical protein ONZ45_g8734 [Pleurotus djamor]
MTEYDYSPEGYRRHMENQARIAQWVDNTQQQAQPPPSGHDLTRGLAPRAEEDLDNLLGPGESISQFNPSPPPLPFYGPQQQQMYPGHQYIRPPPQPPYYQVQPQYPLYQPPPPHHSSHREHRHHRSRSHPRKSSRSHRSSSPTYIISPPGPTPYAYQGVPAAPGSILAMSPPVSPGIPGVPQPAYVVVPRGKTVQIMSPPISPPPPMPYQNGYLQPFPPPQPYPPQPYPQQPMYGPQSAQPTQSYFPPQPSVPGPPTFIPAANAQFLSAPVSRGHTLKKKSYGGPPEWRRSF